MEHEIRRSATQACLKYSRLVIVDPAFEASSGHYRTYATVLLDAARDAGLATALITPRGEVTELGGHPVHNLLEQRFWPSFKAVAGGEGGLTADALELAVRWGDGLFPHAREWSPMMRRSVLAPLAAVALATLPGWTISGLRQRRAAERFARDLRRAEAALGGFGPDDLIVAPNAFVVELDGFNSFLYGRTASPDVALIMRRDLVVEGRTPAAVLERRIRRLIRLTQAATPEVRLLTDTALLADQYATLTDKPVQPAPPPAVRTQMSHGTDDTAARILYVGGARRERGFNNIPALLDACPPGPMRRYSIQDGGVSTDAPDHDISQARLALTARAGPELNVWSGHLTASEYDTLLANADVALLPYSREAYARRSSGVFVEALVNGVCPLVTAGTWMASELQDAEQAHLRGLPARGHGRLARVDLDTAEYWTLRIGERRVTRRGPGAVLVTVEPDESFEQMELVSPTSVRTVTPEFRPVPIAAPRSAVGVIVETVHDLPTGLLEVERHLAHYRDTARAEARARAARHGGTALLAAVTAAC